VTHMLVGHADWDTISCHVTHMPLGTCWPSLKALPCGQDRHTQNTTCRAQTIPMERQFRPPRTTVSTRKRFHTGTPYIGRRAMKDESFRPAKSLVLGVVCLLRPLSRHPLHPLALPNPTISSAPSPKSEAELVTLSDAGQEQKEAQMVSIMASSESPLAADAGLQLPR
jgi:hypothetical protein